MTEQANKRLHRAVRQSVVAGIGFLPALPPRR